MANDRQLPEKKRSDDPLPPRAPDSSTQLAGLAMAGDRDALERLCARYLPRVRGWARGLLPSRARGMWDTSDLASEALARTARRIAAFDRSRGTFRVFLRMILRRRRLRKITKGFYLKLFFVRYH